MKDSFPSASDKTSRSLLLRIQRKETGAWHQLVELYSPLVSSWCKKHGLKTEDTADVMQNVFLTVSKSFGQFRIQSASSSSGSSKRSCFRAWLWTITKTRILDFARRQGPDQGAGGSTALAKLNLTAEKINDEPTTEIEKQSLVGRALQQIRPDFTEQSWNAFWRTVIDHQSTAVVAQQLEMKPAAVRQAKSRILRRLREQLGDL